MLMLLLAPALAQEPHVEVVFQETVPFPTELEGRRPSWRTNRYGQILLVDESGKPFAVDQAGRGLREIAVFEEPEPYRFPMKYFDRWSEDWRAVREETSVPLDQGPDFTGAVLLNRWGADRRQALARLERDGLEIWSVTPPSDVRDYPACFASVPESCLASAVTLLREYAGDPTAQKIAHAQSKKACNDGVVRACYLAATMDGGRDAAPARDCLDGDVEACAVVAGSTYAMAKLQGNSSKAAQRMLEDACNRGVAAACSEAATMFDERNLPHNAILMLDRACVSGDRAACEEVDGRRDLTFAKGIAKGCLADDPVACITLGQFLEENQLEEDLGIDAFGAWERACKAGEDNACRAMAPYVDRWGIDHERVRGATEDLRQACTDGTNAACVGAAHLLVRLDTKDPRYAEARTLYTQACQAGVIEGCLAGAEQSWVGTARKLELPDREALYGTACEAESATGCAGLGRLLARERKRTAEAVTALEKGCKLGSPRACTELGVLALDGRHTAGNDPVAVFRIACDQGEPEACYQLGRSLRGDGDAPPGSEAFALFESACAAGQMDACEAKGEGHLSRGTHYEAALAAQAFDKACDAGRTESCRQLAGLMKRGHGVERDRKAARRLLIDAGELEPIKHVRLGLRLGFLSILAADAEVVLPIPVGPAISLGGDFTYLPGTEGLSIAYLGPTLRIYPSHKARGLYFAAGWHQFRIKDDDLVVSSGFNGRVGIRVQKKLLFGGVEIGLGSIQAPNLQEAIEPVPLVAPMLGLTGGVAFL